MESTHNILDTIFEEDEHPIIAADAKAAYCILVVRRIAYNIVALYRTITQRSATKRKSPYKDLLRDFQTSVLQVTDRMVDRLRYHLESTATEAQAGRASLWGDPRSRRCRTWLAKASPRNTFAQAPVRLAGSGPDQKPTDGDFYGSVGCLAD